jgi:acyl dehydratase
VGAVAAHALSNFLAIEAAMNASSNSSSAQDDSGLNLNIGTYEEALTWIGRSLDTAFGEVEVNAAMIQYYCSAMQDANPTYWDRDFAALHWGGQIAPPGMLQTWIIPLQWRPEGSRTVSAMAVKVPLPGDKPINVSTEFEYFGHVRVGDVLNVTDKLLDISKEKTTKLGTGHFITTVAEYRNQRGELLATNTNVFFRYRAAQ